MVYETSSVLIGFAALIADERARFLRTVLAMRHARSVIIEAAWCCVRFTALLTGVRAGFFVP